MGRRDMDQQRHRGRGRRASFWVRRGKGTAYCQKTGAGTWSIRMEIVEKPELEICRRGNQGRTREVVTLESVKERETDRIIQDGSYGANEGAPGYRSVISQERKSVEKGLRLGLAGRKIRGHRGGKRKRA